MNVTLGVINVSDRASAGVYPDTPGQSCVALLREWLATPFEVDYQVVPDESPASRRSCAGWRTKPTAASS